MLSAQNKISVGDPTVGQNYTLQSTAARGSRRREHFRRPRTLAGVILV